MTTYIIVSIISGMLFTVLDGLKNDNPLAIKLMEGLLRNIMFSKDFFVCGGFFCFAENRDYLFSHEPFLGHFSSNSRFRLTLQLDQFMGERYLSRWTKEWGKVKSDCRRMVE